MIFTRKCKECGELYDIGINFEICPSCRFPKEEMGCCGDCLAEEGKIHQIGCDMERCTKCKGQKLTCDCGYKIKREPYFETCFCCARCGDKSPNLFMVKDEEWEMVCGSTYSKEDVLCRECLDFIKKRRKEK